MAFNLNLIRTDASFDPSYSLEEVVHPDGTITYEEVKLTDPEVIEHQRQEFKRVGRAQAIFGYGSVGLLSFVVSLLSMPVVLILFRSNKWFKGYGFVAAYFGGWIALVVLPLAFFFWGYLPWLIIASCVFFFLTYGAMISIPLSMSRNKGFQLNSRRSGKSMRAH